MKLLPVLLLLPMIAFADPDHECQGGHNCNDVFVDAGSSVTVDGGNFSSVNHNKSYAVGMGDVDIAQCYRSWQFLVFQDSKVNYWCMADSLDARGLHEAAARTRCSLKAYSKLFDSNEACIAASVMIPAPIEPMLEQPSEEEEFQRQWLEEQQELIIELQTKIESLEKKPERKAAPRTIIEQQPFLTEDKRAKLEALRRE